MIRGLTCVEKGGPGERGKEGVNLGPKEQASEVDRAEEGLGPGFAVGDSPAGLLKKRGGEKKWERGKEEGKEERTEHSSLFIRVYIPYWAEKKNRNWSDKGRKAKISEEGRKTELGRRTADRRHTEPGLCPRYNFSDAEEEIEPGSRERGQRGKVREHV